MYKNGGVNPRQPVDQDLAVSPNINTLGATDSYLYKYYMLFFFKYQLIFIIFSASQSEIHHSQLIKYPYFKEFNSSSTFSLYS